MARLSDVRKVFKTVGVIAFGRRVWDEVNKDNLFTWASALAYSWLFAIFPFFIFLLSLIPYLPTNAKENAPKRIEELVHVLPKEPADMLWNNISGAVDHVLHAQASRLLVLGLVLALWSASGGMATTITALDRVYELEYGRPLWKHRLMALVMTVIVAAMLLLVVALLPIGSLVKAWVVNTMGISKFAPELVAFDIVRWVAAVLLMLSVLMVIYFFGPAVKHRFTYITPGSVFVLVVWITMGLGFRFYIDKIGGKSYAKTYGTVGGVAILLLLFYLDALVLLIGAEINSEIDFEVLKIKRGSRDFRHAEDLTEGEPAGM